MNFITEIKAMVEDIRKLRNSSQFSSRCQPDQFNRRSIIHFFMSDFVKNQRGSNLIKSEKSGLSFKISASSIILVSMFYHSY
jgi:hypothetical protein